MSAVGHVSFGSSLTGVMPVVLEVSSKDELTVRGSLFATLLSCCLQIYGKKMIVMDIPNGEKLHRDDYQCWRKVSCFLPFPSCSFSHQSPYRVAFLSNLLLP
eukprot:180794-Hanusia_phi.AAC.1